MCCHTVIEFNFFLNLKKLNIIFSIARNWFSIFLLKKYIKEICVAYKLFNFFSPTCIESCDLRFAYVSTGIGVFPVAKLVVLYACVSYREGSRGRPYIFNVDHSVKRCNINVILNVMPTNHQVDHFCVLLSSNGLDRAYTLKIYWEEEEKERKKKE